MAVVADFIVDKSFPASPKNELNLQNLIQTVKFLVSTLFLVERCV
jgi:hypothetical protein